MPPVWDFVGRALTIIAFTLVVVAILLMGLIFIYFLKFKKFWVYSYGLVLEMARASTFAARPARS